ncbi:MAG: DUF5662 family protein [Candidatus Scatovivens sp.]
MLKNIILHFHTVNKHRFLVFKLCCRAGIPWRGLVHDLSKYSITEFAESVKYYSGKHSPIKDCKIKNGYSKAWLHHKGRNKHHYEYWYDYAAPEITPVIPYKYAVESICDTLAAGIVYNGKNWKKSTQLEYWNNVLENGKVRINKKTENFYTDIYTQVSEKGIKTVITPKNLKITYNKYCGK